MNSKIKEPLSTYLSIFVTLIFVHFSVCRVPTNDYYHYDVVDKSSITTCPTAACKKTADEIINYMDKNVKPCDDFYQFVCGNFLKKSVIKNEQSVNNSLLRVQENLYKQIKAGLEKKLNPGDPEVFKKVKAYYEVCMNEGMKEKSSVAEFTGILKEIIDGWPMMLGNSWKGTNFNWMEAVYKLVKKGFSSSAFFNLDIRQDPKNNRKNRVFLSGPSFAIHNQYFLNGSDSKLKAAYFKFMIDTAGLFKVNKSLATRDMMEVLNLETKLAKAAHLTVPEERDPNVMYLPVAIVDLQNHFSYVPWLTYINKVFAPHKVFKSNDTIIVEGPKYFNLLGEILSNTPKRILANYIGWRIVWQSINSLSKKFKDIQANLSKVMSGAKAKNPQWLVCLNYASLRFPLAIGSMYVKNYFDGSKKQKIDVIIQEMFDTYRDILNEVDWMDEKTKKEALNKLTNMKPLVAHPAELKQYNKLNDYYKNVSIDTKSLIKTELNLNRFAIGLMVKSLDKPTDPLDWTGIFGGASTANAFYLPMSNAIAFPAGILQSPFFDVDLPKYMNLGSIGYVVGHEMTHGFDDVGRNFDQSGSMRDWWDPQTKVKFINKAMCVVDQYSNYTEKSVGLKINGGLTIGENIADNGGIKIAYRTYEKWERLHLEEPRLPGLESYTPRQMFWIANAHVSCSAYRPENLRNVILTDTHATASARVILPLSNRPEFATDFKCPLGSKMNPVKKCSVW